jgi:hypothetical protein
VVGVPLDVAVLAAASLVLGLLLPLAFHRLHLLALARRRRPEEIRGPWPEGELPVITVQLPVYNERRVVERLLDAACSLDYPRDRLEIQLLDDSTDETRVRAARRVAHWRSRGVDVRHVRREDRRGFKAGALAEGVRRARGDFFLVLDADFVPGPDLARRLLPPFRDPGVGMVQARWDHLNEHRNGRTRAQALLLDGHFFLEHGGRYAGGRFFNFNGTAGMWRRRCLEEAGGWQADTLTEDLDLSYRAQMEGWRFVFLEDVGVPAELPARVAGLEIQQKRWGRGGIQTARKILPRLLRGPWSWAVKLEGVAHLAGHLAHPLTLLLGLLILPSAWARRSLGLDHLLAVDLLVFAAATLPFLLFYGTAARRRRRPWRSVVPAVARTLALGVGLSAAVSRAVVGGLVSGRVDFVRTPKDGGGDRPAYRPRHGWGDTVLELILGSYMVVCLGVSAATGLWAQLPFLLLFAAGYLGLGVPGLRERVSRDPVGPASGTGSVHVGGSGVGGPVPAGRWADGPAEDTTDPGAGGEEEHQDRSPENHPPPDRLRPLAGVQEGR